MAIMTRLLAGPLLGAMLLGGCASTPEGSAEGDAEAKQFISHPGTATLYVYRADFPTGSMEMSDSVLYVDHRLIGSTLARTFFRIDLRPGKHLLYGYAYDQGKLEVDTRPGELYFISLSVTDGRSNFTLVDAERGKHEILRCCTLLDNWRPKQQRILW